MSKVQNPTRNQPLPSDLLASLQNRQVRLRQQLESERVDAWLISHENDIRYLTGFVGHDSLLLVTADESIILSDSRYDEFLDPWREVDGITIVMGTRHRLDQTVQELCQAKRLKTLGCQAEHVSLAHYQAMSKALDGVKIEKTSGTVMSLRVIKDDYEVGLIERAVAAQQAGLIEALKHLRIGMTELEFRARLDFEMQMAGAYGPSFEAIVGSGPNSSVIHYQTGRSPIEPGVLLIDWGAMVDGYCSDMTRTFGVGEMPAKIAEIYEVVKAAHSAGVDACRPGMVCAEVDAVARAVISDAGYGEYFGHGLGHGLGMDVHEVPYFNDLQTDVELQPGMVMTVEPGIYIPGIGGVRLEDDVLITENGPRVLSDFPKSLKEAVIEPS